MRRAGGVGLDPFQFHCLGGGGLALDFLLEAVKQLALLNDHGVQLFGLMFEMGYDRLKLFNPIFIRHGG
jgi:hypothetical protein